MKKPLPLKSKKGTLKKKNNLINVCLFPRHTGNSEYYPGQSQYNNSCYRDNIGNSRKSKHDFVDFAYFADCPFSSNLDYFTEMQGISGYFDDNGSL